MVMKLCTVIELKNTKPKLKSNFSKGHRFHGIRLIKVTNKCVKDSFLERRIKEYK